MLCGLGCAAVSSVEMGFWVCGFGGGSSRARYYLQVRRAKRGSRRYTATSRSIPYYVQAVYYEKRTWYVGILLQGSDYPL